MRDDRMEQFKFKETQIFSGDIPNKELLLQSLSLTDDNNDPRSAGYERTLVRPTIPWRSLAIQLIVVIACLIGIAAITKYGTGSYWVAFLNMGLFILLYGVIRLKSIILGIVRFYQYYAPEAIRNRCLFEPSCSEYMVLAVSKYGALQGVRKGVQRLKRCNPQGGGYDWP